MWKYEKKIVYLMSYICQLYVMGNFNGLRLIRFNTWVSPILGLCSVQNICLQGLPSVLSIGEPFKVETDISSLKLIIRRNEKFVRQLQKKWGNKCTKFISHHWDVSPFFMHVTSGSQTRAWCSFVKYLGQLKCGCIPRVWYRRCFLSLHFHLIWTIGC